MTSASKAQRAVAPRAPSWKRKRDDLLRKYQKGNVTKEEAERLMELSQVAATLGAEKGTALVRQNSARPVNGTALNKLPGDVLSLIAGKHPHANVGGRGVRVKR